jgi:hypothetical protein
MSGVVAVMPTTSGRSERMTERRSPGSYRRYDRSMIREVCPRALIAPPIVARLRIG